MTCKLRHSRNPESITNREPARPHYKLNNYENPYSKLSDFTKNDPAWVKKFHIWRMDWNKDSINLYIDDILINTTTLAETVNPDGVNPFKQPHYLLLNLALGGNGGNPSETKFPIRFEIDYVRVYQNK